MNKLFWISWHEPTRREYMPIISPPDKSVLGWWWTGMSEFGHTLCAYVVAETAARAKEIIKYDWPYPYQWRFCVEHQRVTLNFRFPEAVWMTERLEPWR